MRERYGLLKALAVGVALYEVSNVAFSFKTRREIGERDHWTCQYPKCDDGTGRPKSYQNGWMVFAGHTKTHDKNDPRYDEPDTGRIHCIEHEIAFHKRLLTIAELGNDIGELRKHRSALAKLALVDHRTFDYRKNPDKYEPTRILVYDSNLKR